MLYTKEEIQKNIKRKTKRIKIITIILFIILLPICIYNVIYLAQTILKPNQTPSLFGIKNYIIISESMKPELNIGDAVIVKEVNESEIQKGDIISYREGERVITHRVCNITNIDGKTKYITKGDNNSIEDDTLIKIDMVEGKVIKTIPLIGYISIALKNKNVIISLVIVYGIYLLHVAATNKKKDIRDIKRREYEKFKKQEE